MERTYGEGSVPHGSALHRTPRARALVYGLAIRHTSGGFRGRSISCRASVPMLLQRHHRPVDLDLATLPLGLKWPGLKTEVEVRRLTSRMPPECRTFVGPCIPNAPCPWVCYRLPYPQVFADRHGFAPRMSIIDLVCNTGPQALPALRISLPRTTSVIPCGKRTESH